MIHFWKKAAAVLSAAGILLTSGLHMPQQSLTAEAADMLTITNNCFWKDTSNNNIYSQGGGIFLFGDTYYWYGVHYNGADTYAANPTKKNDNTGFASVTCYSSKDLVNWKFENDVLTPQSKNFPFAYWFGRLGVAYNKNTKKYVLVAQHNESVLFASCDSPTGNFVVENIQDQITNVQKQGTGDQTVFVDDDGSAYLICSNKGGRAHQYVSKLRDSDFLYAEPAVEVAKGSGREGNCMFKYNGKYYFCASDLHGWNASHSYVMWADNINGPYNAWRVMDGTDEDFSHVTQTGFFVTVQGSKQETVLFCGDRWSDFAGNGLGYNQWCPLSFDGDVPHFNSLSEWDLNAETGEWRVGKGNNYILNPSFDADRVSQEKLAGWSNKGTGNGNVTDAHTGRFSMQQYSGSAFNGTMSQNIALPNGTYTLKFWAKSSGGQKECNVYAYNGSDTKTQRIEGELKNWKEFEIADIQVTNGTCEVGIYSDGNAGNWLKIDDMSLVQTGAYEPEPIPDGVLIQSLKIHDSDNRADWSIQQNLQNNDAVFGDREFRFTSVPDILKDAEWIRTACDSKKYTGDEAEFTLGGDADIYLGLDDRITETPAWLGDWTITNMQVTMDGDPNVTYRVWKKSCKQGDVVTLGIEGVSNSVNYTLFAVPPSAEIIGDVNADGSADKADLELIQKWLLTVSDTELANPEAADLDGDGRLTARDLTMMKQLLLAQKA